jgi:hypothetical protein
VHFYGCTFDVIVKRLYPFATHETQLLHPLREKEAQIYTHVCFNGLHVAARKLQYFGLNPSCNPLTELGEELLSARTA